MTLFAVVIYSSFKEYCRHAISVLILKNVTFVPDRYIMRSWRRDVHRSHTEIIVNYNELLALLDS